MTDFVLNRDYTHRSTLGHVINFKKGEPTYVPPALRREVSSLGAEPAEGEKIDLLPEELVQKPLLSNEERRDLLIVAFGKLEARNLRGDFTGQGVPSVSAMRGFISEFDLEKKEIEAVWREYQEEKNA